MQRTDFRTACKCSSARRGRARARLEWAAMVEDLTALRNRVGDLPDGVITPEARSRLLEHLYEAREMAVDGRPG